IQRLSSLDFLRILGGECKRESLPRAVPTRQGLRHRIEASQLCQSRDLVQKNWLQCKSFCCRHFSAPRAIEAQRYAKAAAGACRYKSSITFLRQEVSARRLLNAPG